MPVHPRVGVWIEIVVIDETALAIRFTPVWGCGLKYLLFVHIA